MFARGTRARRIAAAVFPLLFAIFVIGAWQLYTVIGDVKDRPCRRRPRSPRRSGTTARC